MLPLKNPKITIATISSRSHSTNKHYLDEQTALLEEGKKEGEEG